MIVSIINTMYNWVEKNNRYVVLFLFSAFLIIGINIYKDYGLSYDEEIQRIYNGYVNYDFIFHNAKASLLRCNDKYHGPVFEVILIFIEKAFKLTDIREIYFMRHLATFLAFFISSVFFYFLSLKLFKDWKLALVGFLFYVLTPHIFAHSFYNSKDAVFLSFFTISIYFLILFHERQTYIRAFLYALITAITIDVRIVGIIIPFISFFLFVVELLYALVDKRKTDYNNGQFLLCFLLMSCFIIFFWPVLWINPIHHFIAALKENSNYYYNEEVFYFGKYVFAHQLPWHYLVFWIFVSAPVIYFVLFLTGTIYILKPLILKPIYFLKERKNETVILIWFFLPLSAIVLFHSVAFDTGRHMYFIHGAFILLAIYGLQAGNKILQKRKKLLYFFHFVLFFSIANVIYKMIKIHPYEHLYFNEVAGNDMKKIKDNFEMDYWGLSSKEVLENILKKDSSKKITIYSKDWPIELNTFLLLPEDRKKFIFTDTVEKAKYYFTDYRHKSEEGLPCQKEFYSAMIGNARISTVFEIRSEAELINTSGKEIIVSKNDFEKKENNWSNNNVVKIIGGSHSGNYASFMDTLTEYSDGYSIQADDLILNRKHIILKTTFWKQETIAESNTKLIVSIETKEGKSYFWHELHEIKKEELPTTKKWEKIMGAAELPEITSKGDIIKIYLWNIKKKKSFIDDFEIKFIQESDL